MAIMIPTGFIRCEDRDGYIIDGKFVSGMRIMEYIGSRPPQFIPPPVIRHCQWCKRKKGAADACHSCGAPY